MAIPAGKLTCTPCHFQGEAIRQQVGNTIVGPNPPLPGGSQPEENLSIPGQPVGPGLPTPTLIHEDNSTMQLSGIHPDDNLHLVASIFFSLVAERGKIRCQRHRVIKAGRLQVAHVLRSRLSR